MYYCIIFYYHYLIYVLLHYLLHDKRYLPLLLKTDPVTSEYPLSAAMKLLAAPLCKPAVGTLIMNLVENILDFYTSVSKEVVAMDTDISVVPAGEIVEGDDSGMCLTS